ncbi:MAG: hypothetical protein HY817_00905 [Candidatus Abawacabacteria bacterium]|nr:hypothetical protein [Candidatus Abawacabacteria bacterium]
MARFDPVKIGGVEYEHLREICVNPKAQTTFFDACGQESRRLAEEVSQIRIRDLLEKRLRAERNIDVRSMERAAIMFDTARPSLAIKLDADSQQRKVELVGELELLVEHLLLAAKARAALTEVLRPELAVKTADRLPHISAIYGAALMVTTNRAIFHDAEIPVQARIPSSPVRQPRKRGHVMIDLNSVEFIRMQTVNKLYRLINAYLAYGEKQVQNAITNEKADKDFLAKVQKVFTELLKPSLADQTSHFSHQHLALLHGTFVELTTRLLEHPHIPLLHQLTALEEIAKETALPRA